MSREKGEVFIRSRSSLGIKIPASNFTVTAASAYICLVVNCDEAQNLNHRPLGLELGSWNPFKLTEQNSAVRTETLPCHNNNLILSLSLSLSLSLWCLLIFKY